MPGGIREIDVRELAARLAAGEVVYLLDVREPWEHAHARLPGSHLIPLGELGGRAGEIAAPPDALVVAYCHHGVRSRGAAALLAERGRPGVASLAGGIDAWSRIVDADVPRY